MQSLYLGLLQMVSRVRGIWKGDSGFPSLYCPTVIYIEPTKNKVGKKIVYILCQLSFLFLFYSNIPLIQNYYIFQRKNKQNSNGKCSCEKVPTVKHDLSPS